MHCKRILQGGKKKFARKIQITIRTCAHGKIMKSWRREHQILRQMDTRWMTFESRGAVEAAGGRSVIFRDDLDVLASSTCSSTIGALLCIHSPCVAGLSSSMRTAGSWRKTGDKGRFLSTRKVGPQKRDDTGDKEDSYRHETCAWETRRETEDTRNVDIEKLNKQKQSNRTDMITNLNFGAENTFEARQCSVPYLGLVFHGFLCSVTIFLLCIYPMFLLTD